MRLPCTYLLYFLQIYASSLTFSSHIAPLTRHVTNDVAKYAVCRDETQALGNRVVRLYLENNHHGHKKQHEDE
jgi:hypothetical protein